VSRLKLWVSLSNLEDLTPSPSPARRGENLPPPTLAGKGVGGLGFFEPHFQARRAATKRDRNNFVTFFVKAWYNIKSGSIGTIHAL